ncbi:hypothetical protein FOE78_06595 [Microlunatus elymi]|uniref:Integral membrane protein n=2 Tax=Microlunatus elymi TaxID=2596828 RepID=A0A516Q5A9_9ACTN|nr:hypothetical protein FOE78_06595 [Microlunatus elymi]
MGLAQQIVLLLHLIAFAALFGGILVQVRRPEPEVNAAMLHGSYTMLITGVVLVVLAEVNDDPTNHLKIGIKLAVSMIITFLVIINRRFSSIPRGLLMLLGLFTLGNATLAVVWQ